MTSTAGAGVDPLSRTNPGRGVGQQTAALLAVAAATREDTPSGPAAASRTAQAPPELATLPAARLAAVLAALEAACALVTAWEDDAAAWAASAPRGPFGAPARARAAAWDAASADLDRALSPSYLTAEDLVAPPAAAPPAPLGPGALRAAIADAVGDAVARSTDRARLPWEAAQAAIDVVAPAAHARALARARGLLLEHGAPDLAALLSTLEGR